MEAIEVQDLKKTYQNGVEAVRGITFSVHYGEIFGLLGPNGAGKSTTIKAIIGLLKTTSGKVFIDGVDVNRYPQKARLVKGYSSQEISIDDKLTAYENIFLQGIFYHLKKEDLEKRIREVLEMLGLWERRNDLVETFSGGMMKRLDIASALIHRPKILILDEPTLGLDIQTRQSIWAYIRKLREETSMTIMLTTHYLEEADELCDRIAIIDRGKILAMDRPSKLKSDLGGDMITMTFAEGCKGIENYIETVRKEVPLITSFNKLPNNIYSVIVEKNGDTVIPELFRIAQKTSVSIESIRLKRPTLDDVYLSYTGKTIREAESSSEEVARERIMLRRMRR